MPLAFRETKGKPAAAAAARADILERLREARARRSRAEEDVGELVRELGELDVR